MAFGRLRHRRNLSGILLLLAVTVNVSSNAAAPDNLHDDSEDTDDDQVTTESVEGVLDGRAALPCDVTPASDEDRLYMVLWFRDESGKPVYSFDVRGRHLGEPRHCGETTQNASYSVSKSGRVCLRSQFIVPDPKKRQSHSSTSVETRPKAELLLDPLQLDDEGSYRCRVDFKNSRTRNYQVNLTVIVPPSEVIIYDSSGRQLGDVVGPLEEGQDLLLKCEVRGGRPQPTVAWFVNDRLADGFIEESRQNVVVSRFTEQHVLRRHHGSWYRCQASNTMKKQPLEKTVRLEMHLKPTSVRISRKGEQLVAGNAANLTCESRGSRPPANLTWVRGDTPVRRGKVVTFTNEDELKTISYYTFNVIAEDDQKTLKCVAVNPALMTRTTDNITLNVVYPPIVSLQLGSKLTPDYIKEGEDVYFECNVRSNPRHRAICWFHNGTPVQQNASAGIVLSGESLVMQKVTREHAGRYVCKASNERGEARSSPVNLRVKYAPVCRTNQPIIVGASQDEHLRVHCNVDADPSAHDFVWHQLSSSGESFEVPALRKGVDSKHCNSSFAELCFSIESERDYGTLTCRGKNAIGDQSEPCVFHIVRASVPGGLINCTLKTSNTSSSSLQLLLPPASTISPPLQLPSSPASSLDVECVAGSDGGLPQTFHLEAYESRSMMLRYNANSTTPQFRLEPGLLSPAKTPTLHLVLFSVNGKGRGPPSILEDISLRSSERHTVFQDDDSFSLSTLTALVCASGIAAALGSAAIALALARRRRSLGESGRLMSSPPDGGLTGTGSLTSSVGVTGGNGAIFTGSKACAGRQLGFKQGDNCYVVAYTLKAMGDSAANDRRPDILESPRGPNTDAALALTEQKTRPLSVFKGSALLPRENAKYMNDLPPEPHIMAPTSPTSLRCSPPLPQSPTIAPPKSVSQPEDHSSRVTAESNGEVWPTATRHLSDSIPGPESCV